MLQIVFVSYSIFAFKRALMRKAFLISGLSFFLYFSQLNSYCQSVFSDYQPLQSKGNIPPSIKKVLSFSNSEELTGHLTSDQKSLKIKKSFLLENEVEIFRKVQAGKILFGDTVSNYISKVAFELLRNNREIFNKLNFFAVKDPDFNAFSSNNGFIFVNTGMIANLTGEAELAFILAHEIAHFIKQHPLESHVENINIIKGKDAYRFTTTDQKLDLLGKRSHEKEFEADSIAIELFMKSAYNSSNILPAIEHMHYSSVPNEGIVFDINFFSQYGINIPSCFFLDSCAKLSPIQDVFDENYSHPNIYKRREHAKKLLSKLHSKDGVSYLVAESDFRYVRQIAQFEQVHQSIRDADYGDAIYNAYTLLKKYPGNKYLEVSIAKAFYGLTKYKNDDKYFYVAEPYEKIEGPSQQIHFFLRQFSRKQLNALSLIYVHEIRKRYPDELSLDRIETDLVENLVYKNNLDVVAINKLNNPSEALTPDQKSDYRQKQKLFENFYSEKLKEIVGNDNGLADKFAEAEKEKDNYFSIAGKSEAEKSEREKKLLEMIRKNGLDIDFNKLLVLDPFVGIDRSDISDEYQDYTDKKILLDQAVANAAAMYNLDADLISSHQMNVKNDIGIYNRLCTYTEGIFQKMSHDVEFFYPVGAECFTRNDMINDNILCFIALFRENSGYKYYLSMIDMKTARTIYWNEANVSNIEKASKLLSADFGILKK